MTFTTPTFLIFLVATFSLYWVLGRRQQNILILAASLVFYGWWDWRFLGLLLLSAGIDFEVARRLMRTDTLARRRALLLVSLASNLGILAFFKYANFFISSFQDAATALGFHPDPFTLRIILPLGISFYTFQALSYTIDVYRKQLPAVDDPVQYFCFITFFPHMVAGPIQRAVHLLGQFGRDRAFDAAQASDGSRQMLWGFYKKMVVADNLAPLVSASYQNIGTASGSELLWATYAFAFQIYCDFSGYTDIAIGCAKLFGFNLTRNFAYPYFARSIDEFWRRWHISLSTWFREYVYIPLGGNRVGHRRQQANVAIVFLLSGFWHGANWTFVVWGLLHGIYYLGTPLIDRWGSRQRGLDDQAEWRLADLIRIALTFQLVCIAWVFFRADSFSDAGTILTKIGHALVRGQIERPPSFAPFGWVLLLLAVEWHRRGRSHALEIVPQGRTARWAIYYAIVVVILLHAQLAHTPFIYFQF
jgi:alginate O-acetyltransferase complex protein AlgI